MGNLRIFKTSTHRRALSKAYYYLHRETINKGRKRKAPLLSPEQKLARKTYQKKWRAAHPENLRRYQRGWRERASVETLARLARRMRAHGAAKVAMVNAAKSKPCADCGVQYPPCVMDFDHVRGEKLFIVGSRGRRRAKEAIIAEISKCDVVCSNCHRLRTEKRRAQMREETA